MWGFPGGSEVKAPACNAVDPGSIPGLGRSPWEGNGYPLQYSCLKESTDREVQWATLHGVAELDMTKWLTLSLFFFINMYRMNDSHFFFFFGYHSPVTELLVLSAKACVRKKRMRLKIWCRLKIQLLSIICCGYVTIAWRDVHFLIIYIHIYIYICLNL